jgi:hypothetical protein
MLTIARNMALGHGMSTADGTIPTNGTQPLMTFIWASLLWLTGEDKYTGMILVQIASVLLATVAGWLLYRLGCWLLAEFRSGQRIAAVTAALWYASPLVVMHSMNCLETGPYALVVLFCIVTFLRWSEDPAKNWSIPRAVLMGGLLGVAFWTRNDAVFLVLALCIARVAQGWGAGFETLYHRVIETIVFGAVSVLAAAPWLIYNLKIFGKLVPISGIKESMKAHFGGNMSRLLANLTEYVLMILPIPEPIEEKIVVTIASLIVLSLMGFVAIRFWHHSGRRVRLMYWVLVPYGAGIALYYGCFFGMPVFVSRYTLPLSPYLALLTVAVIFYGWDRLRNLSYPRAAAVIPVAVLVIVVSLDLRKYQKGADHMHFQVVEWVQQNVPDDVWVGAIQTGTVGFYHDRTLNLDGKVNPLALRAQIEGNDLQYILNSPVQFLADWAESQGKPGIVIWIANPQISQHFELLVNDPVINLGVLRRKTYTTESVQAMPAS